MLHGPNGDLYLSPARRAAPVSPFTGGFSSTHGRVHRIRTPNVGSKCEVYEESHNTHRKIGGLHTRGETRSRLGTQKGGRHAESQAIHEGRGGCGGGNISRERTGSGEQA